MNEIYWDVLIDANQYRIFTTGMSPKENLELMDIVETTEAFGTKWQTLQLNLWEDRKERKKLERRKPLADFMDGKIIPVVSPRARTIMEPLIDNQVEFLSFETPVGPYYGLHVRYIDCLDAEHSSVIRFKSSGRIMEVEKYAFHRDLLGEIHIFRLPELGLSRLFISDEFKRVVETNGLTGLLFYPVPLAEE